MLASACVLAVSLPSVNRRVANLSRAFIGYARSKWNIVRFHAIKARCRPWRWLRRRLPWRWRLCRRSLLLPAARQFDFHHAPDKLMTFALCARVRLDMHVIERHRHQAALEQVRCKRLAAFAPPSSFQPLRLAFPISAFLAVAEGQRQSGDRIAARSEAGFCIFAESC